MLDQNVDRMWYVIGAAIIFGMNTLAPNVMASVEDMFDDVISIANILNNGSPKNLYVLR